MDTYRGPLRDEPLAVELHNTLYAVAGEAQDGLASDASALAWLDGLQPRLPSSLPGDVRTSRLRRLRRAVRTALQAAAAGHAVPPDAIHQLNATSALAPSFVVARWVPDQTGLVAHLDWGDATREEVVLSAIARDAIELLSGPLRSDLRACGAPGCVLLYVKSHPRQGWCSNICGNRARQARHYRRVQGGDDPPL